MAQRLLVLSCLALAALALLVVSCWPSRGAWHVRIEPRALRQVAAPAAAPVTGSPTGFFLRPFAAPEPVTVRADRRAPAWLGNVTAYRNLPAAFPGGMRYHFDGLTTVLKLELSSDAASLTYFAKPFKSDAAEDFRKCVFFGTGFGPTLGDHICFTNPGVNLLPIQGQLWLTIDTSRWGRMDLDTLETIPAAVNVSSLVLNAHPACDRATGQCFVQHPCPRRPSPVSDQVCFSELLPGAGDMQTRILARATLPRQKIIQHSHSPCVTSSYLVSKVDAFELRSPLNKNGGLLHYARQAEDDLWLVTERHTGATRVMTSPAANFVNNHFWNCYEEKGAVVVESVAATHDYLDVFFERNLSQLGTSRPDWGALFHQSLRCRIPAQGDEVSCGPLLSPGLADLVFDYPTFNPLFKMRADYRYFYAIGVADRAAGRWFDTAFKIDHQRGVVAATWSSPGVWLTELDFVPRGEAGDGLAEDDGALVTVLYNATAGESSVALLDARTMQPLALYPLGTVVPFHAHGIVCSPGRACFTNP